MTEAVDPLRPAAPTSDRIAPILFAVAIFTSACLVFVVQPMAAKLLLPTLGGSPSVWNASMVFFQTALLAGYGYAHLLQRLATMRAQVGVHLGLLIYPSGRRCATGPGDVLCCSRSAKIHCASRASVRSLPSPSSAS